MCGIAGIISNNPIDFNEITFFEYFNNSLSHRGPDENINFKINGLGIFHMSRLAINDLRTNQYPLASNNDKIKLIYNGEIYNSREIREKLKDLGYKFKTSIDGEVIVNGYQEWGNKIWNMLNGIFSICLIDELNKKVILARDYLGIKPLFYFTHNSNLYFSSELNSLVGLIKNFKIFNFKLNVSISNINHLFNNMFLSTPAGTVYKEISQIEPANFCTFESSRYSFIKYWDYKDFKSEKDLNDKKIDELDKVLCESVQRQLISDTPVALALSSGLDSNLLNSLITQSLKDCIPTYSANFVNDIRSESKTIISDNNSILDKINFVDIDAANLSNSIDDYIDVYADLISLDGGAITTKILSKRMKEDGIKVCFFGEGADELFGGYSWFGLSSGIYKYAPNYLRAIAHNYAISRKIQLKPITLLSQKKISPFKMIQFFELFKQLSNHLLVKVDRATMSESIEGRVPYLDKNLVELVLEIDEKYLIPNNKYGFLPNPSSTKPALREVARNYLHKDFHNRPKKGFMLPIDTIIGNSRTELIDLFNSDNFVFNQIGNLKVSYLRSKLKTKYQFTVSENWTLWRVMIVQKILNKQI